VVPKYIDHAVLFEDQRLANGFLQKSVSGHNNALFFQLPDNLPENIDGFTANPGGTSGSFFQLLAGGRIAVPVIKERKNHASLLQSSFFRNYQFGYLGIREILLQNVPGILLHFIGIENKEHSPSFEVA